MLRLKLSAERIYLGWGVFDAIYIVRYSVFSLLAGRAPYLDDFRSGMELVAAHGIYAKLLVMLTWGLELSIILSCCLFLCRCRIATWVAYFQVPFRLLFFLPSVSIIFMGPDLRGRYGIGLLLLLLILSECLKVWTLWVSRKTLYASA